MRNKSSRNYWTKVQDQAVIDYQKATTVEERSRIFNDHLQEPMKMIIGGMFVSLGKTLQYIHQDVMNDCSGEKDNSILSHLVLALDKIDTSKNTSFSYLTFTAKTTIMLANMRGKTLVDRNAPLDYEKNDTNNEHHYFTVPHQLVFTPPSSSDVDWNRYQSLCKDWWKENGSYIFPDLDPTLITQMYDVMLNNYILGYKSLNKLLRTVVKKQLIPKILSRLVTINQELYKHYLEYDNIDISGKKFCNYKTFNDRSILNKLIRIHSKRFQTFLANARSRSTVKNDKEVVTNDNQ